MILVLMKKELKQYFSSPIAYILIFFFCFISSLWLFQFQSFFVQNTANLRSFFNIMPLLFVILVPAVTMRTWAEERKTDSEQILLTLPFSETQLVLGKFFSALVLFAIMLGLTFNVPLLLLPFGNFDIGVLFANYIGLMLIISAEVSIGCFLSAVSKKSNIKLFTHHSCLTRNNACFIFPKSFIFTTLDKWNITIYFSYVTFSEFCKRAY